MKSRALTLAALVAAVVLLSSLVLGDRRKYKPPLPPRATAGISPRTRPVPWPRTS